MREQCASTGDCSKGWTKSIQIWSETEWMNTIELEPDPFRECSNRETNQRTNERKAICSHLNDFSTTGTRFRWPWPRPFTNWDGSVLVFNPPLELNTSFSSMIHKKPSSLVKVSKEQKLPNIRIKTSPLPRAFFPSSAADIKLRTWPSLKAEPHIHRLYVHKHSSWLALTALSTA